MRAPDSSLKGMEQTQQKRNTRWKQYISDFSVISALSGLDFPPHQSKGKNNLWKAEMSSGNAERT